MNRVLVAHTPLGATWWATRLQGHEALSSLYEFRLELKSKEPGIDIQSMIGETCAVECQTSSSSVRYFSGLVISVAAKGRSGKEHWLYELTVAPKLWFASRRADFKIYQNLTVQAIADEVLQQNAINYEWRLKNSYKTWEYIVQYGETDLAFLLRLFGHEGIYFWFEHGQNGEKLILADHFSVHEPFAGYEAIPYYPPDVSRVDEDHFHTWYASRAAEPGRFVHTSYDFKHPYRNLETEFNDPRGHLFDQYEIFSYPGTYTESEQQYGQEYAAARLQGLQARQNVIVLEGAVRGALPGCCFLLRNHPVESYNREFTITQVEFRAQNNDYVGTSHAKEEEASFYAKVSAIPADLQYRTPPEKFKMPRAHGPDTAVVVGPPGFEIHTDKYGRIKVHFHWDRYGKKDGQDSCWIRVSSPWAGTSTGTVSIPRVGQEVVVGYEHGDPQRPLVTGCVFNAQQAQSWGLPANKTQSGLMSRSTPGGGPKNFNAIRFENATGKEEMWVHAERDRKQEVKNDDSLWVGGNQTVTIDGNETIEIKGNRAETVHGNETIAITGNRFKAVSGNELVDIKGNRVEKVKGKRVEIVEGHRHGIVSGGEVVRIESGRVEIVGGNRTVKAAGNIVFSTPKTLTITGTEKVVINSASFTLNAPDWHDHGYFHIENYGLALSFKGVEIGSTFFECFIKVIDFGDTILTKDDVIIKIREAQAALETKIFNLLFSTFTSFM